MSGGDMEGQAPLDPWQMPSDNRYRKRDEEVIHLQLSSSLPVVNMFRSAIYLSLNVDIGTR